MFKLSEIKELIKLVDQSSIQELEIENEGARLCIRKPNKTETVFVNALPGAQAPHPAIPLQPASLPLASIPSGEMGHSTLQAKSTNEASNLHRIVSPMVGTYYQASSPEAPPYVKKGDKISDKTVVCIIEAMKLMNDIVAETKGEIIEILVENGQLVEYGQPLFLVKTD